MELGMIGLGRMGTNMVRRLRRPGHQCVVYDLQSEAVEALVREGAAGTKSIENFADKLLPALVTNSAATRNSPPPRRRRLMTAPHSDALVLFGVTGDLAHKMIFPALYALAKRGALKVPVIGVASPNWSLADLRRSREGQHHAIGRDR